MNKEVIILIAEDDEGHVSLIKKNLKRAGISNTILVFEDGEKIINFLFCKGNSPHINKNKSYLLLLDIKMPKYDGIEVLKEIKSDNDLKKLPVIIITTTDDPVEIESCHRLGCNNYIKKPINYENFVEAIKCLGLFLLIVEIPKLDE